MNLGVIGTGYVGLVTGTCFAEMGNKVTCMDIDQTKISNLRNGIIPIYEPGLEEMVKRNAKEGRLLFTSEMRELTQTSDLIFIAVGTPCDEDGSADLKHVLNVARSIAENMDNYKVIITKSTVPVGTADKVREVILQTLREKNSKHLEFDLISNPEFLKEGDAIQDFMRPDRIVIGLDSDRAKHLLEGLYAPFIRNGHSIYFMDIRSAELTKYAANSLLAAKISFMNEISAICEKMGADVEKVRKGIGSDSRIGFGFIYAGIGYGGSCFPKDVRALIHTGESLGEPMQILKSVEKVNLNQRQRFVSKISNYFGKEGLKNRKIAIWGLAFKPGTDDIREAPALDIIQFLLDNGARVEAFDPVAVQNINQYFQSNPNLKFNSSPMQVLKEADALCLVTEWKQFREPDFGSMKSLMKKPVIFDGRNQYEPSAMKAMGFEYFSVGRPAV